jgi:hypothetical protein
MSAMFAPLRYGSVAQRLRPLRSSNRDQETDRRRIALVERAVRSAAAGTKLEHTG